MKFKCTLFSSAIVVVLFSGTGSVQAQPQMPRSPSRPPAFSPYLNLMRSGSPAINYFGLVRPEMQFRQGLQGLANDVAMNQQAIGDIGNQLGGPSATGHPVQFMNLGGYFMNSGGSPVAGRATGGTGQSSGVGTVAPARKR